jgi:hypothetical protein
MLCASKRLRRFAQFEFALGTAGSNLATRLTPQGARRRGKLQDRCRNTLQLPVQLSEAGKTKRVSTQQAGNDDWPIGSARISSAACIKMRW